MTDPYGSTTREAWVAAAQVRNAIQDRIVLAFGKQVAGAGPGPGDADLLQFARAAVAEQRLWYLTHPKKSDLRLARSHGAVDRLSSSAPSEGNDEPPGSP